MHARAAAEHVYYIRGVLVCRVVDPTHLVGYGVFRCESAVFAGEYAFDDAPGSVALSQYRATGRNILLWPGLFAGDVDHRAIARVGEAFALVEVHHQGAARLSFAEGPLCRR